MDQAIVKLLRCFVVASAVIHYYWQHTDGDHPDGKVSIDNIERIVSRLTGLTITKSLVDFEGQAVRANIERYDDHVEINVRKSQSEEDIRYSVVKELFHPLADEEQEFSTEIVKNIRDLVETKGRVFDGQASEEVRSEYYAEIMALELIYPFEYRDQDRANLDAGQTTLAEIAKKRGVPAHWIKTALTDRHLDMCRGVWNTLPVDMKFPPLPEEGGEPIKMQVHVNLTPAPANEETPEQSA